MKTIDLYYDSFHDKIVQIEDGFVVRNIPPSGWDPVAAGIEIRNGN